MTSILSGKYNAPVEAKKEAVQGPVPSAFCRWDSSEMDYLLIHLYRNIKWLTNVKIPYGIDFESVVSELILKHARNYFIVGCNYNNFKYLKDRGYKGIRMGREAILNLRANHFEKKSVEELIKRGKKHGKVEEIPYSEKTAEQLQEFRIYTRHGKEPQLKYLFSSKFEDCNRLFVIRNRAGLWLGAILITFKTEKFAQSEAILCRRNAPIGTMEALIYEIFYTLKNEGYEYWTLGAVPFTIYDSKILSKEYVINVTGRFFRFAYNYRGLFNFKNKFNPTWTDYYVCVRPHFNPGTMFGILRKSNLIKLAFHKMIYLGRKF